MLAHVKEAGAIVAGGLHPKIRAKYFRVGHMGYAAGRREMLLRTVEAVALGLAASGCDVSASGAVEAASAALDAAD